MMWSIMPWRPPMMFINIVGQASFQTAERSGPSTMDRSYRLAAGGLGARVALAALAEVEISLKRLDRRRYEAHYVGQPVGGSDPCPEVTGIEARCNHVRLGRPLLT